jgi:hypothetical protein
VKIAEQIQTTKIFDESEEDEENQGKKGIMSVTDSERFVSFSPS